MRLRANHVADAAHGVNELGLALDVDLGAEQADERVEGVFFDLPVESPDGFDEGAAGDNFSSAVHQALEEVVLGAGEEDVFTGARDFASRRIEDKISHLNLGLLGDRGATLDGAQAGEEFFEGKGLGEVVVGAGVEAADEVGDGVLGSEHEQGRGDVLGAQALGDLVAVERGHHDVEDDDIEFVVAGEFEAFVAIARADDRVALFRESFAKQLDHAGLVFDDEQLHRRAAAPRALRYPKSPEEQMKDRVLGARC